MIAKLWFYNEVLSIIILTWFIAQLLKFLVLCFRYKRVDFKIFVKSGGMPSAHTAIVVALTVALGILKGFNSSLFALSFVFMAIVIYDALGVRQAAGNHAKVLNKIVPRVLKEEKVNHLKTRLGHQLNEVVAGGLLGLFVASACLWSKINVPPKLKEILKPSYLFNLTPGSSFKYLLHFIIIFSTLLVLGIILLIIKNRTSNVVYQKLLAKFYTLSFTIGVVGLLLLFFRYENVSFLAARFLLLGLLLSFFVWLLVIIYYIIKKFPQERKNYQEFLRREQYIPKPKRARRS